MSKLRLLFVKEAQAAYISHLDLMRTFQRCFPRTELDIRHTQGYHPHPILSIVLPLPVGQSSDCELLDFEVTQDTDGSGIADKLNAGMPDISDTGEVVYSMDEEKFAYYMEKLLDAGASVVGGCCGTTPAYIAALKKVIDRRTAGRKTVDEKADDKRTSDKKNADKEM